MSVNAYVHMHCFISYCRCNVKDVAVEVPVPDNTIPDFIIPSHIVVPRCTGKLLFVPVPDGTIPDLIMTRPYVVPR
jgi:hypothetical protein